VSDIRPPGSTQRPDRLVSIPVAPTSAVQRLYRLGSARWYDPFRAVWTALTSRAAEIELDRRIREHAVDGCEVLDIGCGTGHNLGRLRRLNVAFGSYRGVDLTEAMLHVARQHYGEEPRVRFERADLHELRNDPERFDLVLCTWVASHLERPRDVFEIAYDLLAPEGHALLLMLTRPRWYVSSWFSPFARLFQARYVESKALRDLAGLEARRTWSAGMTTLIHLAKADVATPRGSSSECRIGPGGRYP